MTIQIIVGESLVVNNLPKNILDTITGELTYNNPDYINRLKTGQFIPNNMPRYIYLYFKDENNTLFIPKGYITHLLGKINNLEHTIRDLTISPKIDIEFTGKLREYQDEAVKDLIPRRYGLLEAATGSGKTVTAIYIIAHRKVKTLIIVHSKELLDQWVNSLKRHTTLTSVGQLGGGKFDIQDVTVGIINSVSNHLKKIRSTFGQVICDESHRIVSPTWIEVINGLNPKYQLSLSATPYRRDGLTSALFVLSGPKLHVINKKNLENIGAVLVPEVIYRKTNFFYNFRNDYTTMISKLIKDEDRNELIINDIHNDLIRYKEPIMVVSDRVEHCNLLFTAISKIPGAKPILLHGKQTLAYRKEAVESLEKNVYNTLIATTSLLSEGFDSPMLNAVFLTTPIKYIGKLIQLCGRILRPSACQEKPRVYDYRDSNTPILHRTGGTRSRIYKKAGWEFK